MIGIRDLAVAIHAQRYILIFEFHCDISYDGNPGSNTKGKPHDPRTYVFGGFFASVTTWINVERKWNKINADYGVIRFHAAHLNCKTYEYEGWDDPKKITYSKELLDAVHAEGNRMYGVTCGLFADDYRNIISDEGRRKMGHPYLACFNSCVARVARMMDEPGTGNIQPEDKFSVLIDQDDGCFDAVRNFYQVKDNVNFPYRHRLATCAPLKMEECVAMQPADLIAYEAFKRLHAQRNEKREMRHVLKSMMKNNVVNECYFGAATLERMKNQIESTPADDGQLIIIPSN
ncbi:MAG: hypothetical protein ACYDCM_12295 [Candidatus Acidiferrales bacterium]